jgi:dienelactone hydrolase
MNKTKEIISRQINKYVRIPAGDAFLLADLQLPAEAHSLVILAYDFHRSRNHPRNLHVARVMRERGLGTLLCDLLADEEELAAEGAEKVEFLANRLMEVTKWVNKNHETRHLKVGYFGVGMSGSAALIAASKMRKAVESVVCRGGRVDLAAEAIPKVHCPTLLIVAGEDLDGVRMNVEAFHRLTCTKDLQTIAGASQLFGEPGKLCEMAEISANWLLRHLAAPDGAS